MFDKHKGSKPRQAHESPRDHSEPAAPAPSTPSATTGKVAVIGPGIEIDGAISGTENLLVEGQVKGTIVLSSYEVTIGKSGSVKADITGRTIRVSGKVEGDLTGEEKVIIAGSGNVRGNVTSPRVVLEDGAIFKGNIDMDPGEIASPVKAVERAPTSKSASASAGSGDAPKTADLALKSS
ncbi:bactofilin family protein [Elongatibacter sediminis]|uniref:Polymer-forming cytoskeletal protein n=1 Tax=Elongatibacter sediminis TaxID=3119006 RepID=A0AAW9R8U3_9GAMM